mmetsp:Transcript_33064/g.78133  ORF Transcript_33064/g.78133 Transcript_33064/m.78133 type:complete len:285 (+) Transcript_33064:373-1227(+)
MSLKEGDSDDIESSRSDATNEHSPIAFLFIMAFGISALILGCLQNFDCTTVTFPQLNTTIGTQGSFMSGPFQYKFVDIRYPVTKNMSNDESTMEIWEVCRGYSSTGKDLKLVNLEGDWTDEFNEDVKVVRAMAIVAATLGALTMLIICSAPNCGVACMLQWKCYGFMFILTSVFQGLSLLIFGSSLCLDNPMLELLDETQQLFGELRSTFGTSCEIGLGAKYGIASTVLWFLAGVLVCCRAPPGRYEEDCLIPILQSYQQEITSQRRAQAAALEEYERKRRSQK